MNISKGFTLIEILVALLAASIISIMSFDFLSNSVFLKERIDFSIKKDSQHINTINTIRLDLMQAVPFVMKDDNGRVLNTSFIGNDSKEIMTFVSLSTSDHFQSMSKLRRVIYLYEDNQIIRITTLSNNRNVEISRKTLITDINNLKIYFADELDIKDSYWPNLNFSESKNFPKFIFLTYEIDDRVINQVFSTFR